MVGIVEIRNKTSEIGLINSFVNSVDRVYIGKRCVGFSIPKRKVTKVLCIDTINSTATYKKNFSDLPINKQVRENRNRSIIDLRYSVNNDGIEKRVGCALYRLIALAYQIFNDNGYVLSSYNAYDVNHMDGSGSGRYGLQINNTNENLEIVDANAHKLHTQAWARLWKAGAWCRISAEDKELLDIVLSSETKIFVDDFVVRCLYNNKIIDILYRTDRNSPYKRIPKDLK